MVGARIEQVILRRANLRLPFATDFADRLEGQTVRAVNRRAKYLLVELSSADVLVMHLGMSGWFNVEGPPKEGHHVGPPEGGRHDASFDKHDHVAFEAHLGHENKRFPSAAQTSRDEGSAARAALPFLDLRPAAHAGSGDARGQ